MAAPGAKLGVAAGYMGATVAVGVRAVVVVVREAAMGPEEAAVSVASAPAPALAPAPGPLSPHALASVAPVPDFAAATPVVVAVVRGEACSDVAGATSTRACCGQAFAGTRTEKAATRSVPAK
eukprot:TRINITY_DN1590_c0_g1_i23.p4 TRINITY_DN1590_c0_g1~~TRINITY_DN1590_c0_g1_i23.p4  ORF type:complete len:123 (+),score=8.70 TRINITY_DN1590_c0_g1_i23:418-786(+)